MTTKINWNASTDREIVLTTKNYQLRFVSELSFKALAFAGLAGYQLIYRATGHVQAEGLDVVSAVYQTFRSQRTLDRVKANPSLLEEDPSEANLAEFLRDVDVEGQAAN